ncbi:alanine racemase [uncultured Thermanaerothrix sp.]|uniref:alanine racemase n=1 Tax=uncultured Thermanaerothrix sp. TaxID=1195149 RepID=UPI00262C2B46|nr:alanine racemase [uncultured Thermanaerothrix sp.]
MEDVLTTWLEVDLGAIQHNYRLLRTISQRPVMAVIKANAYGHGISGVVPALIHVGAPWCGVARIEEALDVRQFDPDIQILVLGYTNPYWVDEAIAQGICLTVFDPITAEAYATRARALGRALRVHIKVDTGMGRLGVLSGEAVEFVRWLMDLRGLEVDGLYTHFARADESDPTPTLEQVRRFDGVVGALSALGLRPRWVHASNSAAIFNFPQARYDLVRAGIALYGLHPSPETPLPASFRPAMALKARLVSLKTLPPGSGVGYGHRYVTSGYERIGVVAAGYADGIRRVLGNEVLVRGRRVPVLGTPCMDQIMIQLDGVAQAKPGDEVVIFGRQGEACIPVEEVAQRWGTINYEVVTSMMARLPRIYSESHGEENE